MSSHNSSCEHAARKSRCVICHGSEICQHGHRKSRCGKCHGSGICVHGSRREKCGVCMAKKHAAVEKLPKKSTTKLASHREPNIQAGIPTRRVFNRVVVPADLEYMIHKGIVHVTKSTITALLQQASNASPIFNSPNRDARRRQMNVHSSKAVQPLLSELERFLAVQFPTLKQSRWALLQSDPGCQRQMAHIDFECDDAFLRCIKRNVHVPMLALVALQPQTSICLWEHSSAIIRGTYSGDPIAPTKVALEPGDVLLFRADLVHAGSEYSNPNIRLHCYLDSTEVQRTPNRTMIIRRHGSDAMKNSIIE